MELANAIRVVAAVFRQRPSDLLPFYILSLAIPAIAQVIGLVGAVALVGYLYSTGRLAAFQERLAGLEEPPDPADEEAFIEWSEQVVEVFDPLVSIPSIILLVITVAVLVFAVFLLSAGTNAGQLATCFGRLRGEGGVVAGIDGFRRYWLKMAGLYLLEFFLWVTITVAAALFIGLAAMVSAVLALFVAIFVLLAWAIAAVIIRAVFVFAPVALVVEDRSVIGSVSAGGRYIREDFVGAVSYYAVAIGVLIGFSGVAGSFALVGAPAIASLVSLLLIAPALDLLKTVFYGDHRDLVDPPSAPERGLWSQTTLGFRRSLRETGAFVKHTPGYHVAAIAFMAIGFVIGWIAIEPFVGEVPFPSISERFEMIFAPAAPLYFFGNNWSVAMSMAYAGTALALPAAVILWFNGLAFAVTARLEPDPIELAAFVIPHGVIEIPAILISGALGMYLGVTVWRTWRGRLPRQVLAETLRRSVWVLLGVGILLALAGLIEGYFSPYYYRPFL